MSFIKCIQHYYMEDETNLKVLVGGGCVQYAREMKKIYTNLYLHTYLLTPWCRFFLEKLTGLQLAKKFPAFYRTLRFITAIIIIVL